MLMRRLRRIALDDVLSADLRHLVPLHNWMLVLSQGSISKLRTANATPNHERAKLAE
jgi:hypothetical protein